MVFHVRYLSVILGLILAVLMAYFAGFDFFILDKLLRLKDEFLQENHLKKIKIAPKKTHKNNKEENESTYTFFEVLTDDKNDQFLNSSNFESNHSKTKLTPRLKEAKVPRQIVKSIKGDKVDIAVKKNEKVIKKNTILTKPSAPKISAIKTSLKSKLPVNNGKYLVQAGSFKKIESANNLIAKLKNKGFLAYLAEKEVNNQKWFRVYLGSFKSEEDALAIVQKAREEEKLNPMIISEKK